MANFRNTNDLKKDALERAGELTTGTSDFNTRATKYLNDAYQGLFAGGSEFGVDMDEFWIWAKAPRPVILTLQPAFETGTVTLTKGSTDGTFSSAPTASRLGDYLKMEAREEYFRIRAHTAGATAFEIDENYTEDSGTFNFRSIPLEYELSDDLLYIDSTNNRFPFRDTASTRLTATLVNGVYSTSEFSTMLKTQLELIGAQTYAVSFSVVNRQFTISSDGATFFLDFVTGNSLAQSVGALMGYDILDFSGSVSYTATNSLNAIYRIFRPLAVYRNIDPNQFFFEGINSFSHFRGFAHNTPTEQGKIFAIDYNTLIRQFPLTQLTQGTPDKFAEVELRENGVAKLRFNRFPSRETRVEIEYIPLPADLQDNAQSVPLVPRGFRPYLMHAAAYYLMLDKSDNRANTEFTLAQTKLNGMIRANRSTLKQASNNFARLIPRR